MEENCARPLRIADLADVADLSISRFCHLFRTQCGTSPKRMLRYIRLRCAMRSLSCTDMEIKQIAAEIGLARGDALARLFRNFLGTTPGEFRRRGGGTGGVHGLDHVGANNRSPALLAGRTQQELRQEQQETWRSSA